MIDYVYILHSLKDYKRYIGMTSDIQRRIFEHNQGLVKSTRNRRPLDIIYYESFETKSEALLFEKKLKDKKGKINIQLLKEDVNYKLSLLSQS